MRNVGVPGSTDAEAMNSMRYKDYVARINFATALGVTIDDLAE